MDMSWTYVLMLLGIIFPGDLFGPSLWSRTSSSGVGVSAQVAEVPVEDVFNYPDGKLIFKIIITV